MTAARSAVGASGASGRAQGLEQPHAASYTRLKPLNGQGAGWRGVWRAMRVLREFDAPLLSLVAGVPLGMIDDLVESLIDAGHVQPIDAGAGDVGCPRFRLALDAGPVLPAGAVAHG